MEILHGEDLGADQMGVGFDEFVVAGVQDHGKNPCGFEGIGVVEEVMLGGGDGRGGGGGREIWLENRAVDVDEQGHGLLDVTDSSLFYSDFPPLPDFPCMSSASSSSSNPAPAKPINGSSSSSSSASSAASWAVLRPEVGVEDVGGWSDYHQQDQHHHQQQQQFQYQDYQDHNRMTAIATPSSVALSSTDQGGIEDSDCMDVIESLGCIDLLESNEIWDASPLFEEGGDDGTNQVDLDQFQLQQQGVFQQDQSQLDQSPLLDQGVDMYQQQLMMQGDYTLGQCSSNDINNGVDYSKLPPERSSEDDIGTVFLEWLKMNKESISAEYLRRIRFKKSTIEFAARRLGGGKEGMKRLLTLILQWVQNHHLQNKRMGSETGPSNMMINNGSNFPHCQTDPSLNPVLSGVNPNLIPGIICSSNMSDSSVPVPKPKPCYSSLPWQPFPPYMTDPSSMVSFPQMPRFPHMVGYMGADPYTNGATSHSCSQAAEYLMLETPPSWPMPAPPHFLMPLPQYNPIPEGSLPLVPPQMQACVGYGNQNPYPFPSGQGDGLMRLGSSATKEARKKRMARKRRFFSHHRRTSNHHNSNATNQMMEIVADDVCRGGDQVQANWNNWMYWQQRIAGGPASKGQMPNIDMPVAQANSSQEEAVVDKKQQQAWKTEKNLRFLLQKVLKQSDVGNLGRIVLPKKEAETHLPELEARDGITIPMEDIGTSRVWPMRYRFWPNNKSRMYLLENTGEFVRSNGLQEGDFIVIYSDVKCGKYMIRGVKVRPQQGLRSEPKKPVAKTQKTQGNSSLSGVNPARLQQRS